MDKCPCSKHSCQNQDEYTFNEFHCETCFRECIAIAVMSNV
jgi:hypothetical protein